MNIAILTNFQDLNPGYSLTGIVADQVAMLLKHGHNVHLLVNQRYNDKNDFVLARAGIDYANFTRSNVIPFGHLTDYNSMISWSIEHQFLSVEVAEVLCDYIDEHEIDICFTHDWIFTGWNLPYGGGVRFTTYLRPKVGWMHWVHSVPSGMRDWWNLAAYGNQHKIIFPNVTDQRRVGEQFRTPESNVYVIPHIKDMRAWYDMGKDTVEMIDEMPSLMQAEMVQVYPASSDRLHAKGIDHVISTFGSWKKRGISVCLLIANQWATGRQRMEDLKKYEETAEKHGLEVGQDFAFTSKLFEKYSTGINSRMLRELQALSNVFFFPTREESFGLVGPEACFAGVIPVFNRSLSMMTEVYGNTGLYFDYGSFHNNFEPQQGWDPYHAAISAIVYGRFKQDASISAKTHCRRFYNMDYLYDRYYLPGMEELKMFASQCQRTGREQTEVKTAMSNFRVQWTEECMKKTAEKKKKQQVEDMGGTPGDGIAGTMSKLGATIEDVAEAAKTLAQVGKPVDGKADDDKEDK